MCGIVGYIGKKDVKSVLLTGLKALEYRGYDSAGIALRNDEEIQIIKSTGRIKNLEEKLKKTKLIKATSGIAHTRWATHGKANETNAHPHQVDKITLVHNGIIENMDELKTRLIKKGYTFKTETDTEVVAALIDSYLNGDILKAIKKATKDHIYAIRKDSPLLLGLKEDENFFASDLTTLTDYTDKFIFLEEGEIAKLSSNQIVIYDSNLKPIKKEIKTIKLEEKDKGKQGYEHFMLKEIMEEPIVLEKTIKKYLENPSLLPDLSSYKQIHIVACGSAMYAGLIGKYLIEKYASIPCQAEVASEYRYKNNIYDRKTLVILISQSGETADTIAAMREAKKRGIEIDVETSKTPAVVQASDAELRMAAVNVMQNAFHATDDGGKLNIRVISDKNRVSVSFKDTGRGIPPENLRRIFEPFFSETPDKEGTGLGLVITKNIIEKFGGKIFVESTPGRGTTFTFVFERTDE